MLCRQVNRPVLLLTSFSISTAQRTVDDTSIKAPHSVPVSGVVVARVNP